MKWMEVVKVRAIKEIIDDDILMVLADEYCENLKSVTLYRNSEIKNDLSIHFNWGSNNGPVCVSPLGLRVAQGLRQFGMVDHSLWVEQENKVALHGTRKSAEDRFAPPR